MRRRLVFAGATLALVAAACGGGDDEKPLATEATAPPATTGPQPTTTQPTSNGSATTAAPAPSSPTITVVVDQRPEVTAAAAAGWQLTGVGPGVKPVLALDGSGKPAMAFLFERVGEGFVAYATAENGWAVDTVREGYFYGPIDLSFGPQGAPYIAYHDHQADDFDLALGDLTVATFDGERWSVQAARDRGHDGWDSAIVVDSSGTLHAAGIDPSQFGREDGVEYYVNDGSGWDVTAIGSGPIAYRFNVALALDADGLPALSYYNDRADEQNLMFARFDGTSWSIEAVETEGDVGKYSSLAFDAQGRAHISYFVQDGPTSGTIRHAVSDGGGWTVTDVAALGAFEFDIARRNSSLAIDSTGTPHIAFSDTSGVWYAVLRNGAWETQQLASAGTLPLGQLVSLVLDDNDVPHVAFYEVTRANPLDGTIIYATTG